MSAPAQAALALVPQRTNLALHEHIRDVEGIADLVDALDREGELDAENTAAIQTALILAIAGTKQKVDRTANVLAGFESAELAARTERDRLDRRAKYFARQIERLTDYVLAALDASNLPRIDGETSTLARRKNPPRVDIVDENTIPIEFFRWPDEPPPPPPEPDKARIREALKADADAVPGARLVQIYKLVRS